MKSLIVMQSDFGIDSGLVASMHGMCTVSYTHLDVYKRQHFAQRGGVRDRDERDRPAGLFPEQRAVPGGRGEGDFGIFDPVKPVYIRDRSHPLADVVWKDGVGRVDPCGRDVSWDGRR